MTAFVITPQGMIDAYNLGKRSTSAQRCPYCFGDPRIQEWLRGRKDGLAQKTN